MSPGPERKREDRDSLLLTLSFWLLVAPVATTFLLPGAAPAAADLLWLVALVPTALMARRHGWHGAALALGGTMALLVVAHLAASPLGREPSPRLAWVVPMLLATGSGVGWIMERRRPHGAGSAPPPVHPSPGLAEAQHPEDLEESFAAAERGRLVTVVLFELHDLETYVAHAGRAAGAAALRSLREIVGSTTRRLDRSGHLDGSLFLSILSGTGEDGAAAFAERVREVFHSAASPEHGLEVNAGVASYHPSMTTADDLLAAAELALQRGREGGGGSVRIFGRSAPRVPHGEPASAGRIAVPGPGGRPVSRNPEPEAATGREAATFGGEGRRILVVDDGTPSRTLVSAHLQRLGFVVSEEADAERGVRALGEESDALICALSPGAESQALTLISASKARWALTPVVAVTGARNALLASRALRAGADICLFRPFGMMELQTRLAELLENRATRVRVRRERTHRSPRPGTAADAEAAREEIFAAVRRMVAAVELREPGAAGRSVRVGRYACAVLAGLSGEEESAEIPAERLRLAREVCDVGKLAIPVHILNKEERLTEEEYEEVREHPVVSRAILAPLLDDELVTAVAAWHHERWDGKGYPNGLAGRAIPLAARIVAVADSLEAMTTPRAYRSPLGWEDAVGQVRARSGTQFDPALLPAFEKALPRLREIHERHGVHSSEQEST